MISYFFDNGYNMVLMCKVNVKVDYVLVYYYNNDLCIKIY